MDCGERSGDARDPPASGNSPPKGKSCKYDFVGRPANKFLYLNCNSHGQTAQKLCSWDMLEWANAVLGKRKYTRRGSGSTSGGVVSGSGGGGSSICSSLSSSTPHSAGHSKATITRLEGLDVSHLRRLAHHVLRQIKIKRSTADGWMRRCIHSNTSEAHQCDLCVLSGSVKPALLGRLSPLGLPWQPNSISSSNNGSSYSSADEAKSHSAGSGGGSIDRDGLGIFRSGGGGGVFRSASGGGRFSGFSSTGGGGGGGIGGDKERFLTSREADLWSKLVELRDLTAQEPSACFPVGLDARKMKVMLEGGEPPTRASLVRFLMECDESLAARNNSNDGYLNPLFAHAQFQTRPAYSSGSTTEISSAGVTSSSRGSSFRLSWSDLGSPIGSPHRGDEKPAPRRNRNVVTSRRMSSPPAFADTATALASAVANGAEAVAPATKHGPPRLGVGGSLEGVNDQAGLPAPNAPELHSQDQLQQTKPRPRSDPAARLRHAWALRSSHYRGSVPGGGGWSDLATDMDLPEVTDSRDPAVEVGGDKNEDQDNGLLMEASTSPGMHWPASLPWPPSPSPAQQKAAAREKLTTKTMATTPRVAVRASEESNLGASTGDAAATSLPIDSSPSPSPSTSTPSLAGPFVTPASTTPQATGTSPVSASASPAEKDLRGGYRVTAVGDSHPVGSQLSSSPSFASGRTEEEGQSSEVAEPRASVGAGGYPVRRWQAGSLSPKREGKERRYGSVENPRSEAHANALSREFSRDDAARLRRASSSASAAADAADAAAAAVADAATAAAAAAAAAATAAGSRGPSVVPAERTAPSKLDVPAEIERRLAGSKETAGGAGGESVKMARWVWEMRAIKHEARNDDSWCYSSRGCFGREDEDRLHHHNGERQQQSEAADVRSGTSGVGDIAAMFEKKAGNAHQARDSRPSSRKPAAVAGPQRVFRRRSTVTGAYEAEIAKARRAAQTPAAPVMATTGGLGSDAGSGISHGIGDRAPAHGSDYDSVGRSSWPGAFPRAGVAHPSQTADTHEPSTTSKEPHLLPSAEGTSGAKEGDSFEPRSVSSAPAAGPADDGRIGIDSTRSAAERGSAKVVAVEEAAEGEAGAEEMETETDGRFLPYDCEEDVALNDAQGVMAAVAVAVASPSWGCRGPSGNRSPTHNAPAVSVNKGPCAPESRDAGLGGEPTRSAQTCAGDGHSPTRAKEEEQEDMTASIVGSSLEKSSSREPDTAVVDRAESVREPSDGAEGCGGDVPDGECVSGAEAPETVAATEEVAADNFKSDSRQDGVSKSTSHSSTTYAAAAASSAADLVIGSSDPVLQQRQDTGIAVSAPEANVHQHHDLHHDRLSFPRAPATMAPPAPVPCPDACGPLRQEGVTDESPGEEGADKSTGGSKISIRTSSSPVDVLLELGYPRPVDVKDETDDVVGADGENATDFGEERAGDTSGGERDTDGEAGAVKASRPVPLAGEAHSATVVRSQGGAVVDSAGNGQVVVDSRCGHGGDAVSRKAGVSAAKLEVGLLAADAEAAGAVSKAPVEPPFRSRGNSDSDDELGDRTPEVSTAEEVITLPSTPSPPREVAVRVVTTASSSFPAKISCDESPLALSVADAVERKNVREAAAAVTTDADAEATERRTTTAAVDEPAAEYQKAAKLADDGGNNNPHNHYCRALSVGSSSSSTISLAADNGEHGGTEPPRSTDTRASPLPPSPLPAPKVGSLDIIIVDTPSTRGEAEEIEEEDAHLTFGSVLAARRSFFDSGDEDVRTVPAVVNNAAVIAAEKNTKEDDYGDRKDDGGFPPSPSGSPAVPHVEAVSEQDEEKGGAVGDVLNDDHHQSQEKSPAAMVGAAAALSPHDGIGVRPPPRHAGSSGLRLRWAEWSPNKIFSPSSGSSPRTPWPFSKGDVESGGGGVQVTRSSESPRRRAYVSPGPKSQPLSLGRRPPAPSSAQLRGKASRQRTPSPGEVSSSSPRRRGFAALQAAALSKAAPAAPAAATTTTSTTVSTTASANTSPSVATRQTSEGQAVDDLSSSVDKNSGRSASASRALSDGGRYNGREDGDVQRGNDSISGSSDGDFGLTCAALANELPKFLAEAVGVTGSLRALAACQVVNRAWRRCLGGDRGEALFGSIVRVSGVSADLRPAVWQQLVLRAVSGDRSGGDGSSSGSSPTKGGTTAAPAVDHSFARLVEMGRAGPHAALIARDVPRAFGAVAPHKRRNFDSGGGGGGIINASTSLRTSASVPAAAGGGDRWVDRLDMWSSTTTATTGLRDRNRRGLPSVYGDEGGYSEGFVGVLTNFLGGWKQEMQQHYDLIHHHGHHLHRDNQRERIVTRALPPSSQERGRSPHTHRRASSLISQVVPEEGRRLDLMKQPRGVSPFRRGMNGGNASASTPRGRRGGGGGGYVDDKDGFKSLTLPESDSRKGSRRSRWPSPRGVSTERRRSVERGMLSTPGRAVLSPVDLSGKRALEATTAAATTATVAVERGDEASSAVAKTAWQAVPVEAKRECLGNVLLAMAARFPDVGYCQGMDRLLTMLMMLYFIYPGDTTEPAPIVPGSASPQQQPSVLSHQRDQAAPESAKAKAAEPGLLGERVYEVFAGLFEAFRLHDLYVPERGGVLVCSEVLSLLARRRLPELVCHFEEIDFSLDMVAMGWFQTLFVYLHAMPLATLRRIWDWWLTSGEFEVFFRVSMALLDLIQESLLTLNLDGTLAYFNNFPETRVLSPDVLLPRAVAMTLEEGELMFLELQVRRRENLELPSVTELMLRPLG